MRREVVLIVEGSTPRALELKRIVDDGHRAVHIVSGVRAALPMLQQVEPDLVFVSLMTADQVGPRVVRLLKERRPVSQVVALTPTPSANEAVAAIRAGASDYIQQPLDAERVQQAMGRALREIRADRALKETQELIKSRYGFDHILSRSPRMRKVFDQIRAVASTDATVLILGETGTGKELVARAIHDGSSRRDKPYISVNCGAFSESLLESELFGHERGSFTGAVDRRDGVFSMADGGTLFLDELGETSLSVQVNLLRVLEDFAFRRVGGEALVQVDTRIVAATNVDLEESVRAGRFRNDLFYRLNVFPIDLPPLRERREDIGLLLRHFLDDAAREYGLGAPTISADAMEWILNYEWPGNVRQLRAMCERWVIMAQGRDLIKEMLPRKLVDPGTESALPEQAWIDEFRPLQPQVVRVVHQMERSYFHRLLQRFHGHLQKTAEAAGMSRRTLYNKLREHNIDPNGYKRNYTDRG